MLRPLRLIAPAIATLALLALAMVQPQARALPHAFAHFAMHASPAGLDAPSNAAGTQAQTSAAAVERFVLRESGPVLEAPSKAGRFIASIGARAAALGYEHRAFELWAWPLKIADDLDVAFALDGYPQPFEGRDVLARVSVRPESTTLVYTHAAFTVRQTFFVPPDEPAIVMLFDVKSVLPLQVTVRFRPRLRLMWPGTSMTPNVSWDAATQAYDITEESGKLAAIIAAPGARDLGVMPYQEEPRDVPVSFTFDPTRYDAARQLPAVIIAGSVEGREQARAVVRRVLAGADAGAPARAGAAAAAAGASAHAGVGIASLYGTTVDHYRELLDTTLDVDTPDDRLDRAFTWAKVGIDKGLATNPTLGTGLLAGFRTSGDSERPGFAWFFGRDAMWTALATTAYGRMDTTRAALQFLAKQQRADGKIPHEVSQSAAFVPWFTGYPYAWASADATPLFVIAHADYWESTGDRPFLDASWLAIVKAYEFSRATDRDGNGLIENTNVGHGWVEGGALYPAHEEIYMQGLWIEAQRAIAALARIRGDAALASQAQAGAERTRAAVESTYWVENDSSNNNASAGSSAGRSAGASAGAGLGSDAGSGSRHGYYAFATRTPTKTPGVAEPGPNRARRQAALDALAPARRIDEDTVLPAVPLWWRTLDPARAQLEIDRLGSGALQTDWGTRLLSRSSALYDPLSYHYGSVWPLFTGWVSMAAYRHGRPHVGFDALMANALLTETGALGSITELISGEIDAPFGRSSHHQIWSQAMVATPLVRGLLGIDVSHAGTTLTIAPQLPADWRTVHIRRVPAAGALYDVDIERSATHYAITVSRDAAKPSAASPSAAATASASEPATVSAAAPAAAQAPIAAAPSMHAPAAARAPTSSTPPARSPAAAQTLSLTFAPALPLDARVRRVMVNGRAQRFAIEREGDVQRVRVTIDRVPLGAAAAGGAATPVRLEITHDAGSDVVVPIVTPSAGAQSQGLRILRVTPDRDGLALRVEGRGQRTYTVTVYQRGIEQRVPITFEGSPDDYVRRDVHISPSPAPSPAPARR
jgi:glycogen debranching enzyme